jgi:hypothetical protein
LLIDHPSGSEPLRLGNWGISAPAKTETLIFYRQKL